MATGLIDSMRSVYYDLSRSVDLHKPSEQVECFFIPQAQAEPLMYQGKVVGDISQGNSVNCEMINICPHGSCTHTECIGHITPQKRVVNPPPPLLNAILISPQLRTFKSSNDTYPSAEDTDQIISSEEITASLSPYLENTNNIEAVIIRTPIGSKQRNIKFSGTNPPYLTPEAMKYLVEIGCKHLLVDLPSVDKENDRGLVIAHSFFFGLPPRVEGPNGAEPRSEIESNPERNFTTITELCYIAESIPNGNYVLNLQVSPLLLDAIPSRPIIFPSSSQ